MSGTASTGERVGNNDKEEDALGPATTTKRTSNDEDWVGKHLVGNKDQVCKNQVDDDEPVGKDRVDNNRVDDHG